MKNETTLLKQKFNTDIVCPAVQDKAAAWADQQLDEKARAGLMTCYCKPLMKTLNVKIYTKLTSTSFEEFKLPNGNPDAELYCGKWATNYFVQQGMIVGTSIVVVMINTICSMIFDKIVFVEKRHTINDETIGQFQKITILQFINIAIVVLLVNINLLDGPFLGFLPILNGEYDGFTAYWYAQVGKTLTLTLLINIFSPHVSKIAFPLLKLLKRLMDRGCRMNMFRYKEGTKTCCGGEQNSQDDQAVNTKKLLQTDLHILYTGDQISSHYVYAQNYSYLFCVMMYSTGLPILYPFACVFYFVLYWVYKTLLLRYYEKTTKFNEQLPLFTTHWMKVGVLLHGITGLFMYTNSKLIPNPEYLDEKRARQIYLNGTLMEKFSERFFTRSYSTFYLVFWIFVLVWFIAKPTLLSLIWKCFDCVIDKI